MCQAINMVCPRLIWLIDYNSLEYSLMVQLIMNHHWFRWWLGAEQATSQYLKQWWSSTPTQIIHLDSMYWISLPLCICADCSIFNIETEFALWRIFDTCIGSCQNHQWSANVILTKLSLLAVQESPKRQYRNFDQKISSPLFRHRFDRKFCQLPLRLGTKISSKWHFSFNGLYATTLIKSKTNCVHCLRHDDLNAFVPGCCAKKPLDFQWLPLVPHTCVRESG